MLLFVVSDLWVMGLRVEEIEENFLYVVLVCFFMEGIKCFVFDINEVIVNPKELFSARFEKEFGHPVENTVRFIKSGGFQKCLVGREDLKNILPEFMEECNWMGTCEELLDFWLKAEDDIDQRVIEVIEKIKAKGIPCFLATNQEKYRTDYLKNEMGLGKLSNGLISSAEIGFKKPEKEFYQYLFDKIQREVGCEKHEVVLIDDDIKNIKGAEEFGFKVIHYKGIESVINLGL